ncbi:MAG: methylmalonyl Co-A mutase-associated GTPase MeaB, partial [Chloroflexota bacterium]|nr:methylmalonyl Co-A mutase-associated GTPase MeaB [Chloroflexota bacterium]
PTTAGLIHLFDAAGFDPIIVETVGVGQGEIEVAHLAATTLLLQVPGLGDGVQAIKAGILEIGDIVAVNKADLPGAEELVGDLSMMVTGDERPAGWSTPILLTNATTGEGVPGVIDTIEAHRRYLDTSETGRLRRESAARSEVFGLLRQELERESPLHLQKKISRWHELIDDVVERKRTPSAAVAALLGKDGTTCR